MASITESMDSMSDANAELQFLKDMIQKQGHVTPEQREEVKALQRQISRAANKIPLIVGNKSVIVP